MVNNQKNNIWFNNSDIVWQLLPQLGEEYLFLPFHCPDLNPIIEYKEYYVFDNTQRVI